MSAVTSVLVWERQLLCRSGLASIIRREFSGCVVEPTGDAEDAAAWLDRTAASAMLVLDGGIDLRPIGVDGIRGLRRRYPALSIVIVDWRRDRDIVLQAISDGAHGFIPKDLEQDDMLHAFRQVMAGQVYVPTIVRDVDADDAASTARQASITSLTGRQREVLTHMSMGKSNKEIARSLRISESTVKVHVAAAFRQLGVHNRVGAVAMLQSRAGSSASMRERLLGLRQDYESPKRAFG